MKTKHLLVVLAVGLAVNLYLIDRYFRLPVVHVNYDTKQCCFVEVEGKTIPDGCSHLKEFGSYVLEYSFPDRKLN